MIQINQNNSLLSEYSNIKKWYKKVVNKTINLTNGTRKKPSKKYAINYRESINKKMSSINKKYTLSKILIAQYDELTKIKKIFDKKLLLAKDEKDFLKDVYDKFRKRYGGTLCDNLKVSVCPYCNRNFINSYMKSKKTMAEFDHFFNKNDYPIFTISLFNLIPCCSNCNRTKSTNSLNISPYDDNYTTDNLVTFTYDLNKDTSVKSIIINAKNKDKEKDIDILKLESKYQIHKHYVEEIITKAHYYSSTYFNQPILKKLEMTDEELYFGNYLSEENYYKRPLSKLTHDVNEEVKEYLKQSHIK